MQKLPSIILKILNASAIIQLYSSGTLRVILPPRMGFLRLALVWRYLNFLPMHRVHMPPVPAATLSRWVASEKLKK